MNNKKYLGKHMEKAKEASRKLTAFLNTVRIKKGEPFTHTTKSPSGSYYIGEDDYDFFMTIFCNAISKSVRTSLTEKPGPYGPLRTDFDLKSTLENGLKRQYTDQILLKIIKFHQDEIKLAVNPEDFDEKMLYCVLLEKKGPRVEEGKVKDGFHLHFPFFICEPWFQDEYIRTKVNEKMIDSKIWENCKYIEPVEKFIDINMARKQWLMYGSSKDEKLEPFLATRAFDGTGDTSNEISLDVVFEEQMIGRKLKVNYYLPRLMSIRGYKEAAVLKPEIEIRSTCYRSSKKKARNVIVKKRSIEEVLEDIKVIKDGELMSMISDARADSYDTWMDLGWTLFNIGQGCEESLELWIDFSKRSPKFKEGECEDAWGKMEMRDKSIASLISMARTDSPDAYKEWRDLNINNRLYRSLYEDKPNEWDVAGVIGTMYRDRILCADAKKDIWYEFKDHRWRLMDDALNLRKLLATEVVDTYYKLKADIANQQLKTEERVQLERQEKKCKDIITALKTCIFQEKVIKMCRIVFHDGLFLKKMDENKKLFVCENGVLDLELGIFRDGRPDDYCTFSCNQYYRPYTKEDDEWKELKIFFRKVFPDKDLRRYFKDSTCAILEGGNKNKIFIVGTGGGDNAKSVTHKLLEIMFGEYHLKFPQEMLIKGRGNSSSSARPELARVRGKRIAIIQEIAKDETLNIGVLKELTGNDSFYARTLFEKGTEIQPGFTLLMQCNEPPAIPGHDDATWNRVRRLDYESRFVKPRDLHKFPVPASEEEQMKMKRFHADLSFMDRVPDLVPVLLSMFFDRYVKKYKKFGLREPQKVQMATGMYRAMNDVFVQFIQDKIEEVEYPKNTPVAEKVCIRLIDVHAEFTSWYKETHSSYSKEKFDRHTLAHELNKRLNGAEKRGRQQVWVGYRLCEDDDGVTDKDSQLHQLLSKKIEPKIKKVDAADISAKVCSPKPKKVELKPKTVK